MLGRTGVWNVFNWSRPFGTASRNESPSPTLRLDPSHVSLTSQSETHSGTQWYTGTHSDVEGAGVGGGRYLSPIWYKRGLTSVCDNYGSGLGTP